MHTRKEFLAAAASSALLAAAPASPKPAPKPAPSQAKVSQLARVFAQRMRAFDPKLTDTDLETIARNIDANLQLGARIDPGGKKLKNWNEPATTFEATR